jgi:hypothetical protein
MDKIVVTIGLVAVLGTACSKAPATDTTTPAQPSSAPSPATPVAKTVAAAATAGPSDKTTALPVPNAGISATKNKKLARKHHGQHRHLSNDGGRP